MTTMPMDRNELLNAIIDDGIYDIVTNYTRPAQRMKREGGIAGFEACRGLDDAALLSLQREARRRRSAAYAADASDYWWHRTYEAQVDWTINVLSAAMHANGIKPIGGYSARGMIKAADILGVRA